MCIPLLTGSAKQNPLTFRMYARIKMNRPVDPDKDYISPGGYEMKMNNKLIHFDFEEYSVSINKVNPAIIDIECKNPDFTEFEDLKYVTKDLLNHVTEIPEFFIFTGEIGETDLAPVKLLSCTFCLPYDNYENIHVSDDVCKNAKMMSNIISAKE